ncbi:hypothetical protein DFJ77DRAFT_455978 [Powellomyces hirtus]|nr:hypothetical protein DFJ77DRAFT_455978 [Powellomyces hirtus]
MEPQQIQYKRQGKHTPKGNIGSWIQTKWSSVFTKGGKRPHQEGCPTSSSTTSSPTSEPKTPLQYGDEFQGDSFGIPLTGRTKTVDSMTASEFAEAVGIHVLAVNDTQDDLQCQKPSRFKVCVPPSSQARPIPSPSTASSTSSPSPTTGRMYMDFNAATCPIPLRSLGDRGNNARSFAPPALDMSMFLPPDSLAIPPSPVSARAGHSRSPSVPITPTCEAQPDDLELLTFRHTRSQSVCIPTATVDDSSLYTSTSFGQRMVQVSNKGRFTLTREQSDHYTARQGGYVRRPSAGMSRFHVVRSMDRPVKVSSQGDAESDQQTLKSNGTLKSIDSGVAL